ncbi:hypothetical protein [Microbacterium sp. CFBP9034]|uniref:hypothetical protein n=1 Tax=Microbacterium sp. CFBP9034 TaxID=3096540 RepID=UPI002A6A7118|nr:hypothetical protein [Microbacterium sp. CFBP9034]MDY0910309.1 hypothetical protein [Microbacterium sp. CFBP9034]
MSHPVSRLAAAAAGALLAVAVLSACAPDPAPEGVASTSPEPTSTSSASPEPIATITPGATPTAQAEIPDDCRALLTADVLAELEGTPLNDAAFGESGPQPDGSLICVWRDPRADTTGLVTTITYVSRGPALDLLNELADDEGFSCYTPEGGTRCEKTWENEEYPVTDGRTLFWRDGILIDTRFSNLFPSDYTSSIVASIFA